MLTSAIAARRRREHGPSEIGPNGPAARSVVAPDGGGAEAMGRSLTIGRPPLTSALVCSWIMTSLATACPAPGKLPVPAVVASTGDQERERGKNARPYCRPSTAVLGPAV